MFVIDMSNTYPLPYFRSQINLNLLPGITSLLQLVDEWWIFFWDDMLGPASNNFVFTVIRVIVMPSAASLLETLPQDVLLLHITVLIIFLSILGMVFLYPYIFLRFLIPNSGHIPISY